MAKGDLKELIKRRPPWFWWTLGHLLAAAFAVASWSVCLYLFNFPELPRNYDLLRKLKRLTPVTSYAPIEAPDGKSADAQGLLTKFYSLDREQADAHNRYFLRNYITNFAKPEVVNYVEGSYQVLASRALTENDLFQPGLAIRAQAVVQTDELNAPSPYPVFLEILLPFEATPEAEIYPAGHLLDLKYLEHRALILHAAKVGSEKEPAILLTVVPLAYENYLDLAEEPLPLADPDPLNVATTFPSELDPGTE